MFFFFVCFFFFFFFFLCSVFVLCLFIAFFVMIAWSRILHTGEHYLMNRIAHYICSYIVALFDDKIFSVECSLVRNLTGDFKIERGRSASSI